MLRKENENRRNQQAIISVDELVPENHLVRKVDAAINFDFVYALVEDKYCKDNGRPSVDPVVLIKIVLIQYLFGIKSMRQTIREIETNVAYRWFLGYDFTDKIPHFSTFGKNYVRRFKDTNIFEAIFVQVLEEAAKHGLIDPEVLFIDSTHIKASANKKKLIKKHVVQESRSYQEQLDKEIDEDRKAHGKEPLKERTEQKKLKEVKESTTDPDSGYFVKNEKERVFAYSLHAASDRYGYILHPVVTPGNIHDSQVLDEVLNPIEERFGKPKAVVLDAGYKTPYICKRLIDSEIRPVLPYKRPQGKKGFLSPHEYVYDEYYDCYICPANKILEYKTTNRNGYREYHSDPNTCVNCEFLSQCTESKNYKKVVSRHIWKHYLEEADHLRHTTYNKKVYKRRKETIERVFGDLKEKHGMRWTTLRGLEKVTMQALLVCTAMNLKKMANRLWKQPPGSPGFFVFDLLTSFFRKKTSCFA